MLYAWRSLWGRKTRTVLSVLGVGVGVAAIVSLHAIAYGMRDSFDDYMEASGASLVVLSSDAADLAFSRVSPEETAAIAARPGVSSVSRANFTAIHEPRLGEGRDGGGFLFAFGRVFGERIMEKYEDALVDGRMPRAVHEILAGEAAAAQRNLALGDAFPLFQRPLAGVESYEVVGVYRTGINWEDVGVVVHADVIQDLLGAGDSYPLLFVYTEPDRVEDVRAWVNETYEDVVAMPASEFSRRFQDQMAQMDEFILILTLVAMTIGVLGVLNTMMMGVSERTREIGTLRALGWGRRRIVGGILVEGLVISVLGGVVGMGLGVAGTEALLRIVTSGALIEVAYAGGAFLRGALVAVAAGLLGALYPALRASRLRPAEALRYE